MHTGYEDAKWQPFIAAVERKLSSQAFETWFRPLKVSSNEPAGILRISAPNLVVRDWILSQYSRALQESLVETRLERYQLEWTIPAAKEQSNAATQRVGETGDLPLRGHNFPPEISGVPNAPAAPSALSNCSLNEKYTFATFVVASCNRFAHAAVQAIAESPGKTYNPLYLYGGVGLGKTHLMQAAGHAISAANHRLQIAYLSLERFMNELINAIRYGYDKTQAFRERYRTIDVLLIDDVQFIAGKERTQEEFFHTFNALYDRQKQIVLTSDCPPRQIPEIEERLHSRFEWGLIADIEPPDLETKIVIIKRKAEVQNINLSDDVALTLARHSKHNIRELEGSLIRLLAMASLRGAPLTRTLAEESL